MSVQAISWVIEHSRHAGSSFYVLLMIANHASRDGADSFPSIDTLARESRLSRSTVLRAIQALEASGELAVLRSRGRSRPNIYSLPGLKASCHTRIVSPGDTFPHPNNVSPDDTFSQEENVSNRPEKGVTCTPEKVSTTPQKGVTPTPDPGPNVINRPTNHQVNNHPPNSHISHDSDHSQNPHSSQNSNNSQPSRIPYNPRPVSPYWKIPSGLPPHIDADLRAEYQARPVVITPCAFPNCPNPAAPNPSARYCKQHGTAHSGYIIMATQKKQP